MAGVQLPAYDEHERCAACAPHVLADQGCACQILAVQQPVSPTLHACRTGQLDRPVRGQKRV